MLDSRDYFLGSVPLSAVSFIMLHFLQKRAQNKYIRKFLASFSLFGYYVESIIGGNIEYLSFRCFQIFWVFHPTKSALWFSYFEMIFAVVFLFVLTVTAVCLYPIVKKISGKQYKIEGFRQKHSAVWLPNILLAVRFFCGFVHSYLA